MEDVMNLRAGVLRGVVQSIDDSGEVQTATVQTHDGVTRQVEVWQLDGFASVPSGDGAIALMLAVGNDPSQFVALLANPSTRFGKQAPGERTISAPDGTRVAVRTGGRVEIWGATSVTINAPAVTIQAPTGSVTVTVDGDLHATGEIIAGYGTSSQVGVQTHDHDQPPDSHGDTEARTNPARAGS